MDISRRGGFWMFKFNITVCIKYGETEAKNSLKWHYSYRNLIKKLLTLCVWGSSVRDAFFFFFLDTLKTELTVMAGGMDTLADLHRFVHWQTREVALKRQRLHSPCTTLNPLVPLPILKWILSRERNYLFYVHFNGFLSVKPSNMTYDLRHTGFQYK